METPARRHRGKLGLRADGGVRDENAKSNPEPPTIRLPHPRLPSHRDGVCSIAAAGDGRRLDRRDSRVIATLRHRDFALLWTAGLISVAGDFALLIALPLHAYTLTGSAVATGGVFAASLLPQVLLGSIAGVFVDRWDRKRTMVAADLLRAALLLPLLAVGSPDLLWLLYLVRAATGVGGSHLRPGGISAPAPPGGRRAVGHRQRAQRPQQQHRPSRRAGSRRVALCRRRAAGGGHLRRGEFRPLGRAHHGHQSQRATRARSSPRTGHRRGAGW